MSQRLLGSLFCLLLIHIQGFAQDKNLVDSLLRELNNRPTDSIKVKILAELAILYSGNDAFTAIKYGNQGLEIAEKINYSYGKVLLLRNLSLAYFTKSDFNNALQYALASVEEAKKINAHQILSTSFSIVANIYFAQKEYNKAEQYSREAEKYSLLTNDEESLCIALNRLGKIFIIKEKYLDALKVLGEAVAIAKKIKQKDKQSDALFYLAKIYFFQKNYPKSLQILHQCLAIDKTVQDNLSIAMTLKEIARTHQASRQLDSAMLYNQQALRQILSVDSKQEKLDIYETMYLIYKEKGDLAKALAFHEQMLILKDSLFTKDKIDALTRLQTDYEIREKQNEIEKQKIALQLQEKQIEEQHIIRNVIVIGLALSCIVIYFFYSNYKKIKKANHLTTLQNKLIQEQKEALHTINEELNQQNEEILRMNENLEKIISDRTSELKHTVENLSKQNQDLEQFSYIISHNLRAPVARILGLMNIFDKSEIVQAHNQQVITYLEKATQNLDEVIKDLTQIISIRKNLTSIKEQVDIEKEFDNELNYFIADIQLNQITIVRNFQIKHINSVKSYIQSILFNFISNAIKYRSEKRKLLIRISTTQLSDCLLLSFQDNGIGMDLTNTDPYKIFGLYQRMHDHVEGKGLGLYLVKTQVEFLNGTVEVESKVNVGTTFKVYLPI
jgi:signal transduction histidine kinase